MKFFKNHIRLFTGLLGVFVALALLFTMGYGIADTYRSDLDSRLVTQSYTSSGEVGEARYTSDYANVNDFVTAMQGIAERIEEEGVVLLKNSDTNGLPLNTTGNKVTLFGIHSYRLRYGGSVNAESPTAQNVAVATAFNNNGFAVNPDMVSFYSGLTSKYSKGDPSGTYGGGTVNEVPQSEYANAPESTYSDYNDAAIIFLGRGNGEGLDYYPGSAGIANSSEFTKSSTGNILGLSDDEKDLVSYVEGKGCKKVIDLLNTASAMEVQELEDDSKVDAVMWIGNPGPYGINGIARVLNGTESPSGHLADTYAVNTAAAPSAQNYGVYTYSNYTDIDSTASSGTYSLSNSWYQAELEGIYTGYKYYETRYYDSVLSQGNASKASTAAQVYNGTTGDNAWSYDKEVTYPFGWGLSYTTFSEEITSAEVNLDGTTTVSVKVTNTGNVAAKHSVQLYVSLPWEEGQVEKSAIQLVGYAKTGDAEESENGYDYSKAVMLGAGESETVTITVPNTYFASYDDSYTHDGVTGAFVLDAGDYYFTTGNGAHEAVQNVLRAQEKLTDENVTLGTCGTDGTYAAESAGANVIKFSLGEDIAITESEAGSTIENQLQNADLNSYGKNVTYLSRADWDGTFPKTLTNLEATTAMVDKGLKNYLYDSSSYDTSAIPTHEFGSSGTTGTSIATLVGEDFDSEKFDAVITSIPYASMVEQIGHGFQLITAISEIGMPAVNANGTTNGEGATLGKYTSGTDYEVKGSNATYDCRIFPLETVVASTFSHRIAEIEGQTIGNQSLWTGLQWWYGVGSNLHRSPYNGRNMDYYSEDSILSGIMGMDVCNATAPYGTLTGIKHFAFNTTESHRTGVSMLFNEQSARENELRSFELEIKSGSVDGIMTAYNRVGVALSAANKDFITGLLRDEWGYNGIVITDLIQTNSEYVLPKEILAAGSDLVMSSAASWSYYTVDSMSNDVVMRDCVYNAWHHILYSIANSSVLNTVTENTEITRAYPWWEVTIITGIVVTWVLAAASLALAAVGTAGTLKKKEEN